MKRSTLFTLYSTLFFFLTSTNAVPQRVPQDDVAIEKWGFAGKCYYYVKSNDRSDAREKAFRGCKQHYCPKDGPGVGCKAPPRVPGDPDFPKFELLRDDDGKEMVMGTCLCDGDLEFAKVMANFVMEGLKQLDNVICAVMVTAFTTIIENGLMFIPGGQALTAAQRGINAAKTFAENGLTAASFFGDWVGKSCGVPNWNADITGQLFGTLIGAPEWMGTSNGCVQKSKANCKSLPPPDKPGPPREGYTPPKPDPPKPDPPKPDPPKPDPPKQDPPKPTGGKPDDNKDKDKSATKDTDEKTATQKTDDKTATQKTEDKTATQKTDDKTATQKTDDNASTRTGTDTPTDTPTASTSEQDENIETGTSISEEDEATMTTNPPTASTTGEACQLLEARAGARPGKDEVTRDWLAPETIVKCDGGGARATHITYTPAQSVGEYQTVIEMKCPSSCLQACYHYRSVMSVHTHPNMQSFTCGPGLSKDGKKTDAWGVTATGANLGPDGQHWWPWANGFVTMWTNPARPIQSKGCQRDEWPPRLFWPGDEAAAKRNMLQRVRFIPSDENSCGGRVWAGFCEKNAARALKGKKKTPIVRSKYIDVVRSDGAPRKEVNGQKTTFHSTVSINTAVAVFTMADWDGLPQDKDHGLWQNTKCWPSDLAPNDPGFALLTDDEWYMTQHPDLQIHTASYRGLPDLAMVKAALAKNNGKPPFDFKMWKDDAEFKAKVKAGVIPDAYRGVLPGVPPLPASSSSVQVPLLFPLPVPKMRRAAGNETLEEDGVVDFDGLSDEELDAWMEEYVELVRRAEEAQEVRRQLSKPRDTIAVATPIGQGGPTPTAAMKRTAADADVPKMTGGF